jgi:outer membrane scaffolding protein for murein synthesis (MipA/OmpV family)
VFPDYRGSAQSRFHLLPLPFVTWRGDRVRLDRDGLRGLLFKSERFELDLSLGGSLPVDSDRNALRQGMPDLDFTFEVGPELKWRVAGRDLRSGLLHVKLPVRLATATDFSGFSHVGWVAQPQLRWKRYFPSGNEWAVSVGPSFGDRQYHDYFYGVPEELARPGRPAYEGRGGYSGTAFQMGVTRRIGRFWLGAFVRYDYLAGASFTDSPLFETDHSLIAGAGIAWLFARSKRLVPVRD